MVFLNGSPLPWQTKRMGWGSFHSVGESILGRDMPQEVLILTTISGCSLNISCFPVHSSQERVKGLEERAIGIDDSEQDWGGVCEPMIR